MILRSHLTDCLCLQFDWATEAVCDEKRPRGRPSVPKYCNGACSCSGVDMSALKDKVYTVHGGGDAANWTYVISLCGPIPASARKDVCAGISPTATAMRYYKPSGSQPTDWECELLGAAQTSAVPTSNGVELLYGSPVNSSSRCPDGATLQLAVVCDAAAAANSAPGVVTDISSAAGGNNACVFATRLRAPCAVQAPAAVKPSHTIEIVLIVLACVVVVGGGACFVLWRRRKRNDGTAEPLLGDKGGPLGGATSW